jgi:hypothetical protein
MIDQVTTTYPMMPVYFAGGKHPYALGPLPMDQVTPLSGELDNGYPFTVQVPTILAKMQHDPQFLDGCQFGYECYDDQPGTVLSLCNFMNQVIHEELLQERVDFDVYLWVIGYALGWLAGVAETEPVLAHVGILHLCFLLSYIPPSCLQVQRSRFRAIHQAAFCHMLAMKAYRARVRELTNQGVELHTAYQQALVPSITPLRIPVLSRVQREEVSGIVIPFRARGNGEQ